MDDLKFDEENHIYTVKGIVLPSVTQVLSDVGIISFNENDPVEINNVAVIHAADFGKKVHRATELYDLDRLDIKNLDPAITPYLIGWEKFKEETNWKIKDIELKLHEESFLFAGTIDRIAEQGSKKAIIEIKTSATIPKSAGLQTAAYQFLYNKSISSNKLHANTRIVVLLKPDSYKLKVLKNKIDINLFLSALSIYKFKRRGL